MFSFLQWRNARANIAIPMPRRATSLPALKKLAVEVDPRQQALAFVASAVRHVVVLSLWRRFLPWTDAFQPLQELAEARLLGERSGFLVH
jgi:hypothetical protein